MDSLRQLSSPTAFVIRNGEGVAIPAKNLVPGEAHMPLFLKIASYDALTGDLVNIKTGDVVPADVRPDLMIHETGC
jgi:P-type Na+/K+ transporter